MELPNEVFITNNIIKLIEVRCDGYKLMPAIIVVEIWDKVNGGRYILHENVNKKFSVQNTILIIWVLEQTSKYLRCLVL